MDVLDRVTLGGVVLQAVLVSHAVVATVVALLAPRLGPRVFLLAALAPFTGCLVLAARAPRVLHGPPLVERVAWVPDLALMPTLRLDPLSVTMLVLVCGVAVPIFGYTATYASRGPAVGRFAWQLTAFAGAMVGLVLADDALTLYVFWELTTLTSFLLVGLDDHLPAARRAARQALVITVAGGLAMLVGLLILAHRAGTTSLSGIVAAGPAVGTGGLGTVAVLLVLLGAFTKSAQVPFHSWLPGAMAAPTPVSAYLHAAAMVKAGVYLVARLSPGFAGLEWWRPLVVTTGVLTLLVGGVRSLRQHDLKLVLAFSTVSQLGLLMVAAGWGTPASLTALTLLLLAHGFAKSTLFLATGVVDHAAHTRDLRRLSGLWRSLPAVAVAGALAGASLAGIPLLLGFVAKEHLLAAAGPAAVTGVVAGSALTSAYALRWWWGAFADKRLPNTDPDACPGDTVRTVPRQPAGLVVPLVLLAGAGLACGILPRLLTPLTTAVSGHHEHLATWPGFTPDLGLSALTWAAGAGLFLLRSRILRLPFPRRVDTDAAFERTLSGLDRLAHVVTGRTQTGSLPTYLGVTALVVTAVPVLVWAGHGQAPAGRAMWAGSWTQAGLCLLLWAATAVVVRARRRVTGVLALGAVGYAVTVFFVLQGAPDLALTQALVETVSVVVFLLVLPRLSGDFVRVRWTSGRAWRVGVAGAVGVAMTVLTLVAAQSRPGRPTVAADLLARSASQAHGRNVVNVILVDFRGFDTFGEITVVFAAALGVLSLVTARRAGRPAPSTVLDRGTRWIFPAMLLVSLHLLVGGHNNPGGGFVGGLLAGLAFILLHLAGDDAPARAVLPVRVWLGAGLLLAAAATAGPWLAGGEVLQSHYASTQVPVLGHVGVSSALVFDTGVYLVVTGLVLAVLATLGRQQEAR